MLWSLLMCYYFYDRVYRFFDLQNQGNCLSLSVRLFSSSPICLPLCMSNTLNSNSVGLREIILLRLSLLQLNSTTRDRNMYAFLWYHKENTVIDIRY